MLAALKPTRMQMRPVWLPACILAARILLSLVWRRAVRPKWLLEPMFGGQNGRSTPTAVRFAAFLPPMEAMQALEATEAAEVMEEMEEMEAMEVMDKLQLDFDFEPHSQGLKR